MSEEKDSELSFKATPVERWMAFKEKSVAILTGRAFLWTVLALSLLGAGIVGFSMYKTSKVKSMLDDALAQLFTVQISYAQIEVPLFENRVTVRGVVVQEASLVEKMGLVDEIDVLEDLRWADIERIDVMDMLFDDEEQWLQGLRVVVSGVDLNKDRMKRLHGGLGEILDNLPGSDTLGAQAIFVRDEDPRDIELYMEVEQAGAYKASIKTRLVDADDFATGFGSRLTQWVIERAGAVGAARISMNFSEVFKGLQFDRALVKLDDQGLQKATLKALAKTQGRTVKEVKNSVSGLVSYLQGQKGNAQAANEFYAMVLAWLERGKGQVSMEVHPLRSRWVTDAFEELGTGGVLTDQQRIKFDFAFDK